MTLDERFNPVRELQRRVEELENSSLPPASDKGGGSGGGMDQRLGRLEGQVDRMGERIDRVGDRLGLVEQTAAAIKEKLNHMPTRFEFYTVITGSVALAAGLVTLATKAGWLS